MSQTDEFGNLKEDYVDGQSQFAYDLCEALGLSNKIVRTINLHIQANDFVSVTVTSLVPASQASGLIHLIKQYRLVKQENEVEQENEEENTI